MIRLDDLFDFDEVPVIICVGGGRPRRRRRVTLNPSVVFRNSGLKVGIKGDGMIELELFLDDEVTLRIAPKNREGNPATLDNQDVQAAWAFVGPNVGTLTPAADGLSAL